MALSLRLLSARVYYPAMDGFFFFSRKHRPRRGGEEGETRTPGFISHQIYGTGLRNELRQDRLSPGLLSVFMTGCSALLCKTPFTFQYFTVAVDPSPGGRSSSVWISIENIRVLTGRRRDVYLVDFHINKQEGETTRGWKHIFKALEGVEKRCLGFSLYLCPTTCCMLSVPGHSHSGILCWFSKLNVC